MLRSDKSRPSLSLDGKKPWRIKTAKIIFFNGGTSLSIMQILKFSKTEDIKTIVFDSDYMHALAIDSEFDQCYLNGYFMP